MRSARPYINAAYDHRRAVIATVLALILIVSAGVVFLGTETTFDEVQVGSDEEAALERLQADFAVDEDVTYAQLVLEAENVFDKETLVTTLELQSEIRGHETIEPTLVEDRPTLGVANIIAESKATQQLADGESISLQQQIEIIESMSQAEIDATVQELLGYSLDVVTASLTIGIDIDYSIHVTERFRDELEDVSSTDVAIRQTLRGTGGALFESAATTAAGFGVLAFAINPMLQQFGLITAVMIVFVFIGAVVLLPSLLLGWSRLFCGDPALACSIDGTDTVHPSD